MRTVINKKILEIYHNYDGDIDGLLRTGRISDLEALGSEVDNIWADITSFIQNKELIQKGLVSQESFGGLDTQCRLPPLSPDESVF